MKSLHLEQLHDLFHEVQMQNVLGDGKTFPDCIPKKDLTEIQRLYVAQKNSPDFDLHQFVLTHFELPKAYASGFVSDATRSASEHIMSLWDLLTRQPTEEVSSLISLPYHYVVPGGRFREIYYWDSYFNMLGLQVSDKKMLIEGMINNFTYLINTIGYIPNGNRSYFLGRSQPPFYSLMVELWAEMNGKEVLARYLPALEKEYQFWMQGATQCTIADPAHHRVVRMSDGTLLNRYWDEHDTPRPEAYKEDVELSHQAAQPAASLFRNLRAAAESGWDFSSRWFKDGKSFASIHTTEIIPVDLNCLMHHLEKTLAEAHHQQGNSEKVAHFTALAEKRKIALSKYCWNIEEGFFHDYDFVEQELKSSITMAGAFPLFFHLATPDQALATAKMLEAKFLKPGGLTTTLEFSGQQWDAPNGWAPLQWIGYQGLRYYGFDALAKEVKQQWTRANEKVYAATGKMTEKYDVWNAQAEASGGEYPNQDGFGWTNGVYLAMKASM